jgi:hypothetical protein
VRFSVSALPASTKALTCWFRRASAIGVSTWALGTKAL